MTYKQKIVNIIGKNMNLLEKIYNLLGDRKTTKVIDEINLQLYKEDYYSDYDISKYSDIIHGPISYYVMYVEGKIIYLFGDRHTDINECYNTKDDSKQLTKILDEIFRIKNKNVIIDYFSETSIIYNKEVCDTKYDTASELIKLEKYFCNEGCFKSDDINRQKCKRTFPNVRFQKGDPRSIDIFTYLVTLFHIMYIIMIKYKHDNIPLVEFIEFYDVNIVNIFKNKIIKLNTKVNKFIIWHCLNMMLILFCEQMRISYNKHRYIDIFMETPFLKKMEVFMKEMLNINKKYIKQYNKILWKNIKDLGITTNDLKNIMWETLKELYIKYNSKFTVTHTILKQNNKLKEIYGFDLYDRMNKMYYNFPHKQQKNIDEWKGTASPFLMDVYLVGRLFGKPRKAKTPLEIEGKSKIVYIFAGDAHIDKYIEIFKNIFNGKIIFKYSHRHSYRTKLEESIRKKLIEKEGNKWYYKNDSKYMT